MKHERALAYAAFLVVCIVWGTTYLAIRVAVRTIPPMLLTSARFVVAGVILLAFALLRREPIPRDRRTLVELIFVGLLMVGIGNFTVVWAEQWVPSGDAALLVATAPFWLVLMERMRAEGERIDGRRALGMVLGFIGVALLVTPGGAGRAFDAHFIAGALCMQAASIAWQYGTIRAKVNLHDVPPLMSSAFQMLSGGVAIGIIGVASGEPRRLTFSGEGIGALAYLTIFGSVLAYTSYVYAVRNIRVTTLSLYAYINPLVAVILGWLILSEQLTPVSIVAMLTILGGVAIVQTSERRIAGNVAALDRRRGGG
ncbi:MAG TPA: EamA family transporter [Thermoanaerobaculia bacterium]